MQKAHRVENKAEGSIALFESYRRKNRAQRREMMRRNWIAGIVLGGQLARNVVAMSDEEWAETKERWRSTWGRPS